MTPMTPSPNFDCLKGENRFFVKGSSYCGDGSQYSNVYDHLLRKWFLVTYAERPAPSRTTAEDEKPVSDDNVIKDLSCIVHQMGNHNVLSQDYGGNWHTASAAHVDLTTIIPFDPYTDLPDDAVRVETLHITGAVAPLTYVVGHWEFIYK